MKKVKGLFLAALAATAMFTSCGSDDDAKVPVISFPNDGGVAVTKKVGDSISFQVDVTPGDGKLITEGVDVTLTLDGLALDYTAFTTTESGDNLKVIATYKFTKAGVYVFTIDAIDKDDVVAVSQTKTVTVEAAGVAFTKEITTGVVWNAAGPGQGAWDLDADAALSSSATASIQNLDVVSVAFTGKFKSENGTSFVKVAAADYATLTQTTADAAFTKGTAVTEVTPVVNDVYVAKKGTSIYLIKITAVDATAKFETTSVNNGKITFSYKK